MRASCSRELMAPMSVFLSSGSPSRSVDSRRFSDSSTSSWMFSCTSSREPAQQTWPWLKKMPLTMPSTAWSTGASSKTMLAALPPSSSVTFFFVPAVERAIILPTSVEPVNATLLTSPCSTSARPVSPAPVTMLTTPGGQVGLLADLGEQQRGERCGLGGLEHDRVARSERRRDLPRQHEQREVPRDDLAGHAQRLGIWPEARMVELVGPARVVEEPRGHQRDVDVARLADRLAVVERLEHGELAGAFLQDARDAVEILPALARRHLRPDPVVRAARGLHRAVDVGLAGLADLGEHLFGRGADRLERTAVDRVDELAVDEQAVGRLQVDDRARLRRRGVLELLVH